MYITDVGGRETILPQLTRAHRSIVIRVIHGFYVASAGVLNGLH
jgi:hypothetical protein